MGGLYIYVSHWLSLLMLKFLQPQYFAEKPGKLKFYKVLNPQCCRICLIKISTTKISTYNNGNVRGGGVADPITVRDSPALLPNAGCRRLFELSIAVSDDEKPHQC